MLLLPGRCWLLPPAKVLSDASWVLFLRRRVAPSAEQLGDSAFICANYDIKV